MHNKIKTGLVLLMLFCLPGLISAQAQAQSKTYMYDHVHMAVPEPEVAAQWYKDNIGGEFIDGRTDRLLFGTTRIMFLNGDAATPSTGGVVDHLGFSFTDLTAVVERVRAAGATVSSEVRDVPGLFKLAFIVDPFGNRMELIEDAQHLGFHHVHLRSTDPQATFAWYEATFGGIRTNMRGRLDGILYPGNVWLLISQADSTFPSEGASIDHIGWRALDSAVTIADLQAKGVEFTSEPRDMTLPNGIINFFYVQGPEGARIELVHRAPDMR